MPLSTIAVQQWTFTRRQRRQPRPAGCCTCATRCTHALGDSAPDVRGHRVDATSGAVRTVEGTIEVPLYLSNDGGPGSVMVLDEDGLPTHNAENRDLPGAVPLRAADRPGGPGADDRLRARLLGNRGRSTRLQLRRRARARRGVRHRLDRDVVRGLRAGGRQPRRPVDVQHRRPTGCSRASSTSSSSAALLNDERGVRGRPRVPDTAEGTPIIARRRRRSSSATARAASSAARPARSRPSGSGSSSAFPGINYSLLLPRSSDWPQFQAVFDAPYPDEVDRVHRACS